MRQSIIAAVAALAFSSAVAAPPPHAGPPGHAGPPATGLPAETGRYVTYLAVDQTPPVAFHSDTTCTDSPPSFGECVTLNPAPATTSFAFDDMISVDLPAGATNSLICFTFTPFHFMSWSNPTGTPQQAQSSFVPRFRIVNPVLDGLTNTSTGLPFNGEYEGGASTYHEFWTLQPGESASRNFFLSRACTGGLINARLLSSLGLSDAQVRDFFAAPMTLSFGVAGSFRLADAGQLSVGVRLYGD